MKISRNHVIAIGGTAVVIGLLVLLLMPSPLVVGTEEVRRSRLQVTLEGEGASRVREHFMVSAPAHGKFMRIGLDEGDRIEKGDLVAVLVPPPLNSREYEETESRISSAAALLEAARKSYQQVTVDLEQADRQLGRYKKLYERGAVSRESLEEVQRHADVLRSELGAAASRVESAGYDLKALQAVLESDSSRSGFGVVAPESGVVLRVLETSERVVAAGTPLVEIGNPADVELVVDVLSSDAVGVLPGMRVEIMDWGGDMVLAGIVRRVEPAAFTKVSALGIEEKRVNVIIDLRDDVTGLGDNYRVQARIILWEGDNVLQVPVSSLFRGNDGWAVFRVRDGRAHVTPVDIGRRGTYYAEVVGGLSEGDQVVVHPTNDLQDGMRVRGER